ncbi:MAG: hypothetical protein MN733_27780, partial [Nitrososphaera sp.]|nr:hypothetical protein [Nitrososphaera sp.]
VTWKDDRHFVEDVWKNVKSGEQSDGQKVLVPALKALGLKSPVEAWMRIGFVPSPSGRKDTDQNGQEKIKQLAVPVEVFKSHEAALAAVTKSATNGSGPTEAATPAFAAGIPEGYTAETWADSKEELLKKYQEHVQTLKGPLPKKRKEALDYIAENEAGSSAEQLAELIGVYVGLSYQSIAKVESMSYG